MEDDKSTVIIVKKKVSGHGGHHGGSWKVAYADFVTAMMALFIVLWLTSQSETVKQMVQSYFQDPVAFEQAIKAGGASGLLDGSSGVLKDGNPTSPTPESVTKDEAKKSIEKLKKEMNKLQSMIASDPELAKVKDKISMTVTEEGLRIELEETKDGMFFEVGSADIKPEAIKLLTLISRDVGEMPNNVVIEGHSDARPYVIAGYSNWELSSDRANAARGVMEAKGLRAKQVAQVSGFADRRLKMPDKPLDYANRRVSILVPPYRPGADKPISIKDRKVAEELEKPVEPSPPGQAPPAK